MELSWPASLLQEDRDPLERKHQPQTAWLRRQYENSVYRINESGDSYGRFSRRTSKEHVLGPMRHCSKMHQSEYIWPAHLHIALVADRSR